MQRDIAAQAKVEQRIRRMLPPETKWQHRDPLEAADMYRTEADAWLSVCRREVDKLTDFEVTSVLNLGDGKTIEKVGAEVRAIVTCYVQALDRCFGTATAAIKLNPGRAVQRSAGTQCSTVRTGARRRHAHARHRCPTGALRLGDPAGHRNVL